MIDQQVIEIALKFMGRAQMTGNEVPEFVHASNALHAQHAHIVASAQRPSTMPPPTEDAAPLPVSPRKPRKST